MVLNIILLILAVPIGFFIAYLARDELLAGRIYFRVLIILSILGIIGFWIYGNPVIALTFGFIGIVALVSFVKSYDKKWTKKKI